MKELITSFKELRDRVLFFFPVQLLLLNFKKNQVLLIFWMLLFSIITSNVGRGFGLPYLFLDPEYQHDVNFNSMFILGISYGIFTISFFITSYILDGHRFAFLGTIKYPFVRYCFNNSVFPLVFFILYLYKYIQFQNQFGFESTSEILIEATGFVAGSFGTVLIIFAYFRKTNKDVFKALAKNIDLKLRKKKINTVRVIKNIKDSKKKHFEIQSYLDLNFRIKPVDQEQRFDRRILLKVIDQHHLNAVSVETLVFIAILIIGIFRDNPTFQIPAGASALLFASFIIMFTGAFSYWLRGWAITGLIILLFGLNYLVKKDIIHSHYEAFGINYQCEKADYSLQNIEKTNSDENYIADTVHTKKILNNWKAKFSGDKKPKMVLMCFSGGGQRSAVWTMNTLQHVDKSLNGELMNHTMLMTGASGGLIGASYFREIYYRHQLGTVTNPYDEKYVDNISKDILNPMIFSMVVSDIFLRFQKFKLGKYEYYKGRGYAFEEQLNVNTDGFINKRLRDYYEPEFNAKIPLLIMSPSIINDGRKLNISSQPVTYMGRQSLLSDNVFSLKMKGVDYQRFFKNQDASNIRFLSALRMSATFPYITPNVHLPSEPAMEIMDAGLSDNFGITDAIRFLYTFKSWIEENTSGVVFVSIRDSKKDPEVKKNVKKSMWNKVFNPIGSIYSNWDNIQDYKNDSGLEYASTWFKAPIDYISFEYIPKPKNWDIIQEKQLDLSILEEQREKERASLSWHLTTREKQSIKRTVFEQNNVDALEKLRLLLGAND